MRRVVMVALMLVVLLAPAGSAFAQDQTPVPGPEAVKHLLAAKALGKGWTLSQTVSPDVLNQYFFTMSPDVFRAGAAGVYLGPSGAQVVLVSLLLTTNRVAIRTSWDDASKIIGAAGNLANKDFDKTTALESADPPKQCVEAKREVGTEQLTGLPYGATMCAVDPDGILVAITFGTVDGMSGVDASDAVIELALGLPPSTPTPTPAA